MGGELADARPHLHEVSPDQGQQRARTEPRHGRPYRVDVETQVGIADVRGERAAPPAGVGERVGRGEVDEDDAVGAELLGRPRTEYVHEPADSAIAISSRASTRTSRADALWTGRRCGPVAVDRSAHVARNRLRLDLRAAPGLHGGERMAALEAECDRLATRGRRPCTTASPNPR